MVTGAVRRAGLIASLAVVVSGCASVRREAVRDEGFGDVVRLTNGTVEVVVAPAVGRIVRYGFVGGPNALWADARGPQIGGWPNFGGSKVWPWPQDGWEAATTRPWPPPGDGPGEAAFVITPIAGGLRLTGRPLPGYGRRVVRDIRLDRDGTGVTLAERLEPTGPSTRPAASVWTITQVPAEAAITVDGPITYDVPLPPDTLPLTAMRDADRSRVVRGKASGKAFFAASVVTARIADGTVFTIALSHPPSRPTPGQCQAYVEGTAGAVEAGRTRYAELEFAAAPTEGASTLDVRWTLRRP